jgi:uncharacterized protein YyaL (SSP411 family)
MNEKKHKYTNLLINESSPYLLQHAHNPVEWHPWGEEALNKAKAENKLILVSIGYAACHWCHVMEHETFENEKVAELMNRNFVCIKVDREERPDIDHVYMNAVHLINGQGGWPLNCFALPDTRPVFGGTYFRTQQWMQILEALSDSFKNDPESFEHTADEIHRGIILSSLIPEKSDTESFHFEDLQTSVENYKPFLDMIEGGTIRAPKFPMPVSLNFLIDYTFYAGDNTIENYTELTLKKMAEGGIYDQIGGGFARYSTDEQWLVPHFEKMLYDNAQLVSLYSRAYLRNPDQLYKKTLYQTLSFLEAELSSPENAFYSSLDADSEGEEGRFYVWEKSEIDSLLDSDSGILCSYYNVSEKGNWEDGKNILHINSSIPELSNKFHIDEDTAMKKIKRASSILLQARNKKVRPGLDDKILTSWNALMISAYCEAYRACEDQSFLSKAEKTADFILKKQASPDFRLNRIYKNGSSSINGFLDDYALTIEAFLNLYRSSAKEKYLLIAGDFQEYAITHFYDDKTGMFYYTSDIDSVIITKKYELDDNVIPSSNSVTARNLYMLGFYFYNEGYTDIAQRMFSNVRESILNNIGYFANWASLSLQISIPPFELVIIGEKAAEFRSELLKKFRPDMLIAVSEKESSLPVFKDRFVNGKTAIYVCRDHRCSMPVFSIEEAEQLCSR